MRPALTCDHGGFELKASLITVLRASLCHDQDSAHRAVAHDAVNLCAPSLRQPHASTPTGAETGAPGVKRRSRSSCQTWRLPSESRR